MSDNPDDKIDLKIFHAEIVNDHDQIAKEEKQYEAIPQARKVKQTDFHAYYDRVRGEVQRLVSTEINRMNGSDGLRKLVIRK